MAQLSWTISICDVITTSSGTIQLRWRHQTLLLLLQSRNKHHNLLPMFHHNTITCSMKIIWVPQLLVWLTSNRTLLSPRSQQIMQYLVTILIFRFQWWSKLDTIRLFQCIRSRSCTCLWRVWRTTGPSPAWPPIGRGQQQQTLLFTSSYPCHQSHLRQALKHKTIT